MDKHLIGIIERMLDTSDQITGQGYDSSSTISWKALREAEKLDNADYFPSFGRFVA
jgi:hypothetical protein